MSKTVFKNAEVAHVWAQRQQTEGRNANRSVYFEGDTIYSYGNHFPMARFVQGVHGQIGVLVSTKTYSITTSGHQSSIRSAITQYEPNVFHVPDVLATGKRGAKANLKHYREALTTKLAQVSRARLNAEWRMSEAERLVDEANAFCAFYGLGDSFSSGFTPETLETARAEAKASASKQHARAAILAKDAIVEWLAGKRSSVPNARQLDVMLRVKGDEVQTSLGASFPINHARLGLALVRRTVAKGETWHTNGHTCHLGHYKIDRITPDGTVYAGCHVVTLAAIERIADQLEGGAN